MFPVRNIMTTNVISVPPEMPIYEALDLLIKNKISGMPVLNSEQHVVGILTEKDVLSILLDQKLGIKNTVQDYMSKNVVTFKEDDSAIEICKFFIQNNIRRVPIVRDGKLVGIVSRRDLVALIFEAKSKMSDLRYA